MAATTPLKNHPAWKDWMAQADPLKEVSKVKKLMACRYSSLPIQLHTTLQNGRFQVVFWKKYSLYKYLMLQKDPLNSSRCQKIQYPERKLRL